MAQFSQSNASKRLPFLRRRRVLIIDAGSHSVKLLLVRRAIQGLRILWHECVDLRGEGLLSLEDLSRHLRKRLQELDYDQLALVLPQHLSLSQIIDLPSESETAVSGLIEEEIVKLSGLSESAIVFDYSRIRPVGGNQNPFWVTLCQEREVLRHVEHLAAGSADVCEVTPAASAMISAFQANSDVPSRAVLIDLGAENTIVVIVLDGQGVFASTFPIGGNAFTAAIVEDGKGAFEQAEELKHLRNLFDEPNSHTRFVTAVDEWCGHVSRTIQDWIDEKREDSLARSSFKILLCGGGAAQHGIVDHLQERVGLTVSRWTSDAWGGMDPCPSEFIIAYGAAMQVFGKSSQPASLLPANLREVHSQLLSVNRLQTVGVILMLLAAMVLSYGTWHKLGLVNRKDELLSETQAALAQVRTAEGLLADLARDYERIRPVLDRQRTTWETLKTLSLLQHARSNRSFWYVLFADQQSYFSSQIESTGTNLSSPLTNRLTPSELLSRTNVSEIKRGFIAELCIPDQGTNTRWTLSDIVTNLRIAPLFRKVDALPPNLKRDLVDPKLIVPNRHFALTIELKENEFRESAAFPPQPILPGSLGVKPAPRTFQEQADRAVRPPP